MRPDLLGALWCPACHGDLTLQEEVEREGHVESGQISCRGCDRSYPVSAFIPRFVTSDNYTSNFSLQWRRFRRTQLDSHTGTPISRNRFFRESRWRPEELAGRRVLDLGCGAGRFTEVALSCGARVVAVDASGAADACWDNFALHPRLDVMQADVWALPFRPATFDYVYCFGVLQHTPDVRRSFHCLPVLLRTDGRLAVDVYPRTALTFLWPKYWLRPITRRMDPGRLFGLVQALTPSLLSLSRLLGRVPGLRKLRHAVPVANYEGVYPLTEPQLLEFSVLDTFDMFAPAHDHPQTVSTLRAWFREAGLAEIEVERDGLVVGRAVKH